jgi:hypothetical protein
MKIDPDGPAFGLDPREMLMHGIPITTTPPMTIRTYIAAKVLAGFAADSWNPKNNGGNFYAHEAYRMAVDAVDGLIAELNREQL